MDGEAVKKVKDQKRSEARRTGCVEPSPTLTLQRLQLHWPATAQGPQARVMQTMRSHSHKRASSFERAGAVLHRIARGTRR